MCVSLQAQRWRVCTEWQGRTWRRWRLWCSAWVRPPSLLSSPSPASWPLFEARPWTRWRTDARAKRCEPETSGRLIVVFVEGEEASKSCGTPRLDAREGPRSVNATIIPQRWGNSIQAGCLRVREQHLEEIAPPSAHRLESHVVGVYGVAPFKCANSLLWDILAPLWLLTLRGFLLHFLGRRNVSFSKRQTGDGLQWWWASYRHENRSDCDGKFSSVLNLSVLSTCKIIIPSFQDWFKSGAGQEASGVQLWILHFVNVGDASEVWNQQRKEKTSRSATFWFIECLDLKWYIYTYFRERDAKSE